MNYPAKETVLTGLRANNDLHIGNYFGALLPMIDMARQRSDEYQINLFVPDLHSFTTPIDHSKLQEQIFHTLRLYVAAGLDLDNENVYLYRQSYVPAHSELTWILDCFTGMGEMSRMTQFKDKSTKLQKTAYQAGLKYIQEHNAEVDGELEKLLVGSEIGDMLGKGTTVGLFNYPVLMAADILLYNAKYIPVGDDQTQHLEFARDIAERMNKKFGDIFVVPHPVAKQHEFFGKDQGLRIKDLADPTKKMSKSDDTSKGVIFLGDNPDEAAKKILSATTDSIGKINFDWENQPGVTNLLQILALLTGRPQDEVNSEWEGKERYGEFKQAAAAEVKKFLVQFQTRLEKVDDERLVAKLKQSERAMNQVAGTTLLRAQQAVGLRPRA